AHALQGTWVETERVLSDRFRLPPSPNNPAKSRHLPNLVVAIFRTTADRNVWAYRVGRLAEIAREAQEGGGQQKAKPSPSPANTASAPAPPCPLAILG